MAKPRGGAGGGASLRIRLRDMAGPGATRTRTRRPRTWQRTSRGGRGRGGRRRGRVFLGRALLETAGAQERWLSGGQERAMAGNAQGFRFVGFSSHRYTAKFGNSVSPVSSWRTSRLPAASHSTTHYTLALGLVRIQHQLWPHFLVKLLRRQIPQCHRRRLQRRALLVCLLGALCDI